MAFEVSLNSIDESRKEISGLQATCLPQRKDSLHPSVPLFTGGTLGSFAPEDSKAEHALGMIVRRSDALFYQEEPKGIDLSVEPQGKPSRRVLAISMKRYESDEAGVEGSPLSYRRGAMCHVAESLKLCERPFPKPSYLGVLPLGKLPGFAD